MSGLTARQRTARFLFVVVVASLAGWGAQFLPPEDYQPSRPLYATGWLLASVIGYFATKDRGEPWRSAFLVLSVIFTALLAFSFVM